MRKKKEIKKKKISDNLRNNIIQNMHLYWGVLMARQPVCSVLDYNVSCNDCKTEISEVHMTEGGLNISPGPEVLSIAMLAFCFCLSHNFQTSTCNWTSLIFMRTRTSQLALHFPEGQEEWDIYVSCPRFW